MIRRRARGTALVYILDMAARILVLLFIVGLPAAADAPRQDASASVSGYAWADACKKCHEPIYNAWAKTKHATALALLDEEQRKQDCAGCHVTGQKSPLVEGTKVVNEGVQCEACHGPGAAHAADPKVTAGLVKAPPAETCEACHSTRSPHFRGFFYGAMAGLVHPAQ